jgi:cysteine desulfurase
METIYLDNNATTRIDPEVLSAMLPFLTEHYGNPSSAHGLGETVALAVRQARRQLCTLLGAASDQEIVFTSGGTEADNTAILSALETQKLRRKIVISAVEHPAVLQLCAYLRSQHGMVVERIGVDRQGRLDRDAYRAALGPGTALVSMMWANNETGTIFPIEELAAEARACGALFHTDAVQAVGKLPIDLKSTQIDMLSLSGHKLHGPKGIGALYVRKGVRLAALLHGGKQERGRRAGTENVPGIVALGKAAELASQNLVQDQMRIKRLRDRFEQGVLAAIPDTMVLGDTANRLVNTSLLAFDRADAEPILQTLAQAGIAISSGSACSSGSTEPSHVLKAMAVPYSALYGAIRVSFSHNNTDDHVGQILALLPAAVAHARRVSSYNMVPNQAVAAE